MKICYSLKKCYDVTVTTLLKKIWGISWAWSPWDQQNLSKQSTLFTIYLLNCFSTVLQKCLQLEKLDLAIIASVVGATLHTPDDLLQPAANWLLKLQEVKDEMETTIGIKLPLTDITNIQSWVVKSFLTSLKNNIQNWFNSQDVVSSFCIFDLKKYQTHQQIIVHMVRKPSKPSFCTMVECLQQRQKLVLILKCHLSSLVICKQSRKLFQDT